MRVNFPSQRFSRRLIIIRLGNAGVAGLRFYGGIPRPIAHRSSGILKI